MITVYFMRGQEKIPVQVDEGRTLMEAARDYSSTNINEIPADCSCFCACDTCHIKVDQNWIDKVGEAKLDSMETELLEYEKGYDRMRSRLACQIQLEKKHNGLVAHLLDNYKM